jgi:hypothetical protein
MGNRIDATLEERSAGVRMLRSLMPLPDSDGEAAQERKLLHRADLREAVRK